MLVYGLYSQSRVVKFFKEATPIKEQNVKVNLLLCFYKKQPVSLEI